MAMYLNYSLKVIMLLKYITFSINFGPVLTRLIEKRHIFRSSRAEFINIVFGLLRLEVKSTGKLFSQVSDGCIHLNAPSNEFHFKMSEMFLKKSKMREKSSFLSHV